MPAGPAAEYPRRSFQAPVRRTNSTDAQGVSPEALGVVEILVGLLEHRAERRAVLEMGAADAHRDRESRAESRGDRQALDRHAHAFGDGVRRRLFRERQKHHELLATEAGEQVGVPKLRLATHRHLFQRLVAPGVALRIVDGLEAIDVDHQQGHRKPAFGGGLDQGVRASHEGHPVERAGEPVGAGDVMQLGAGSFEVEQQAQNERTGRGGDQQRNDRRGGEADGGLAVGRGFEYDMDSESDGERCADADSHQERNRSQQADGDQPPRHAPGKPGGRVLKKLGMHTRMGTRGCVEA